MKKKRDKPLKDKCDSFSVDNPEPVIVKIQGESLLLSLSEYLARHKDLIFIVLLFLAALAVRTYSLKFFDVIPTDGTSYVETARGIRRVDIGGIGVYGFYPVLIWVASSFISDSELA